MERQSYRTRNLPIEGKKEENKTSIEGNSTDRDQELTKEEFERVLKKISRTLKPDEKEKKET
jgi:hypothetical protein